MEDDPILARARLLVSLAGNASGSMDVARTSPRGDTELPEGTFLVTAIKGSSQLSTKSDLRNVLKRGANVTVDGVEYTLSSLSDRRIELSSDFAGSTNLQAMMIVRDFIRSSPKKNKNSVGPVSSSDIRDAIRALDSINPSLVPPRAQTQVVTQTRLAHTQTQRTVASTEPKRRQSTGGGDSSFREQRPTSSTPPFAMPRFEPDGSYLASLIQGRRDADTALEEQRELARARVLQKKREDAQDFKRRAKEEEDKKASMHLHMEMKAKALRERTAARVSDLQRTKLGEERAKKEAMELQLKRKAEADSKVQSEDYQKRMAELRLQGKQRMKMIKALGDEQAREQEMLVKKKLFEISEQRRRPIPGGFARRKPSSSSSSSGRERERQSGHQDRPYSDSAGRQYSSRPTVEDSMERDLDPNDDEGVYGDDDGYRDFAEEDARASAELSQQHASAYQPHSATSANAYHSSQQQRPPIIYNAQADVPKQRTAVQLNYYHNNDDDDDDDDDGYWSNDSLGDDHLDFSFKEPQPREQVMPPQQRGGPIARSLDVSDDCSLVSAISFGSPKRPSASAGASAALQPHQQYKQQAICAMPKPKPTKFKPLKPLPVPAYVPLPK